MIATPEEKVSFEHNLQMLTKNPDRPQDKEWDAQKLATHNRIMVADNKDQYKLEFSKVLKRVKAIFQYYEPVINRVSNKN